VLQQPASNYGQCIVITSFGGRDATGDRSNGETRRKALLRKQHLPEICAKMICILYRSPSYFPSRRLTNLHPAGQLAEGRTAYDPGTRNPPCYGQEAVNDGNPLEMEPRQPRQRHKHKLGGRQGNYCAARLIDTAESGAALKGTRHQCNSESDIN
jgi:hypothetical protein